MVCFNSYYFSICNYILFKLKHSYNKGLANSLIFYFTNEILFVHIFNSISFYYKFKIMQQIYKKYFCFKIGTLTNHIQHIHLYIIKTERSYN